MKNIVWIILFICNLYSPSVGHPWMYEKMDIEPLHFETSKSVNGSRGFIKLRKRNSVCGNGELEDGEECDPGITGSSECCTKDCQRRPDFETTCDDGRGICRSGSCVSRSTQCSAFDDKILSIKGRSIVGPFIPCNPDQENQSDAAKENLQAKCSLACQGRVSNSGSNRVCIDLQLYQNVDSTVSDGLICGNDESGVQLGVCVEGTCKTDSCRQSRCFGRGDCFRSEDSSFSCRCDPPYNGKNCESRPDCDGIVDRCGICNGDGTQCDPSDPLQPPSFVNTSVFRNVVLPIVIIVGIAIFAIAGYISYKKSKEEKLARIKRKNSKSRLTTSKKKLSNVSTSKADKVGISVRFDEFQAISNYDSQLPDEIELREGDIVFKLFEYDDGWAKGYNTRTQEEGVYPVAFTEKVAPSLSRGLSNSSQKPNSSQIK